MTGLNKTEQFLHENITWKRLLDFFMQENSYLKTRLSKVVDRENDNLLIVKAEYFQNEFILKDEYIQDIENDIEKQKIKSSIKNSFGLFLVINEKEKIDKLLHSDIDCNIVVEIGR